MRVLLVSDLHYALRHFDWVIEHSEEFDLVAVAGDCLDISSMVPLEAQAAATEHFFNELTTRTTVVTCSGNHDLDSRNDAGEKVTTWLEPLRRDRLHIDGDSFVLDGVLVSACAWWEGPVSLSEVEAQLEAAARQREGRWVWVYHSPPEGPLSWTGSRHFGDPELPRLVERFAPDVVLCGHIHEAPFTDVGNWAARVGETWLFNAGRVRGEFPAHVALDLDAGIARWESPVAVDERDLRGVVATDQV